MNCSLILLTVVTSIKNHDEHNTAKEEVKTENQSESQNKKTGHEHSEKFGFDLSHDAQEVIPIT